MAKPGLKPTHENGYLK